MRAVVAVRPGPPEVLEVTDLPDPVPGPGEVVVAVEVAATTFIDTQVRAGRGPRPLAPGEFPLVLGNGVAGKVAAVGGGVDRPWLGAAVVTSTGGRGGYASRAVAAVGDLHLVPENVDALTAAALLADGRTALGLVHAARISPGETAVVTAAAGGVGSLLVQLVRRAGGEAVALAGGRTKVDHARLMGASRVVDYREPGWPERLDAALDGHGIDVAFDGVGAEVSPVLAARLGPGGRYLPHGAASGRWGTVDADDLVRRRVGVVPLSEVAATPADAFALVEEALQLAASGVLRPTIGQVRPLEEAAAAHAAMEARSTLGKTLLLVSPGREAPARPTDEFGARRPS
jgi:NADPH:quinone reductase